MEKIGSHLFNQPDLDIKRRVTVQTMIMQALAKQGRGAEAMQLMQDALTAAGKLPSLRVLALLKGADIQWNYPKEYQEAAQLYEKIISEHRGPDIPAVREAAIHWGDLYTQAGDMTQAKERYRLAKSLGGGRWSEASTWRGGAVPAAEDDAVIAARDTVLFDRDDIETPTCKQLILDPNSNLAFQSGLGKRTLTVNGPIEAFGSLKMHAAAASDAMEIRLASTVAAERVIKLARGGALLVLGRAGLPDGEHRRQRAPAPRWSGAHGPSAARAQHSRLAARDGIRGGPRAGDASARTRCAGVHQGASRLGCRSARQPGARARREVPRRAFRPRERLV